MRLKFVLVVCLNCPGCSPWPGGWTDGQTDVLQDPSAVHPRVSSMRAVGLARCWAEILHGQNAHGCAVSLPFALLEPAERLSGWGAVLGLMCLFVPSQSEVWNLPFLHPLPAHPGTICESSGFTFPKQSFPGRRARRSLGFAFRSCSLLYLDAADGQTLEPPHFDCALGSVPCGRLEAFWVSFDGLPRRSPSEGRLGARRGLGPQGSPAGAAAPRAAAQTCQLVGDQRGRPLAKYQNQCCLRPVEGWVSGCHGYELPENIAFCILFECSWKIRKGSLKGKEIKYKQRPREKYVVKRFYLKLFYLLKQLTYYKLQV